MSVKVHLHPYLREAVKGKETVEASGKTVGKILIYIDKGYPGFQTRIIEDNGQIKSILEVYVNDRNAYPEELEMPVNDGDEIFIVTLAGGG
jgi:sulfur-carrier protein